MCFSFSGGDSRPTPPNQFGGPSPSSSTPSLVRNNPPLSLSSVEDVTQSTKTAFDAPIFWPRHRRSISKHAQYIKRLGTCTILVPLSFLDLIVTIVQFSRPKPSSRKHSDRHRHGGSSYLHFMRAAVWTPTIFGFCTLTAGWQPCGCHLLPSTWVEANSRGANHI